jgi:hypothetical protein
MDDRRQQVKRNQRRKEHERHLMLVQMEKDQHRIASIQEEVKSVAEEVPYLHHHLHVLYWLSQLCCVVV